jgi:antitoxin MazE
MDSRIIKIGNSQGLILPTEILRQLHLSLRSKVNILLENGKIVIQSAPREGWAEAAQRMAIAGDDALLMPDVFEDETLNEWTWDNPQ